MSRSFSTVEDTSYSGGDSSFIRNWCVLDVEFGDAASRILTGNARVRGDVHDTEHVDDKAVWTVERKAATTSTGLYEFRFQFVLVPPVVESGLDSEFSELSLGLVMPGDDVNEGSRSATDDSGKDRRGGHIELTQKWHGVPLWLTWIVGGMFRAAMTYEVIFATLLVNQVALRIA